MDKQEPNRRGEYCVQHRMGELLGQALRQAGISQRRFASLVDVSEAYVSRILRGRQVASTRVLDAWARELGFRFLVELVLVDSTELDRLRTHRPRRKRGEAYK